MDIEQKGSVKEMKDFYIDIHSHMLSNVDDGAKDMDMSKKMLSIAYEQGIKAMILTPHFYQIEGYCKERVEQQFQLLLQEAYQLDPEIELFLGNEIFFSIETKEALKSGLASTLAQSRYVLIEFSQNVSYRTVYEGMRELIFEGYAPVIAHVERYYNLRDYNKIRDLIELGCYIQVNADSFIGGIFNKTAKFCKQLVSQGLVHFIATDSHNCENRKPLLKDTVGVLRKLMKEEQIHTLLYENPMKIRKNKYI